MKMRHFFKYGIILLALFPLVSCTTTRAASSWNAVEVRQPAMDNVLIAGITDHPDNRAFFEETLATELSRKGVDTVKSTALIPDAKNLDTQTALAAAKTQGIDFVLVTQILEIGEKDVLVTEYNPILWAYESGGGHYGLLDKFQKKTRVPEKFVKLQTKLYDAHTEEVVWSAVSETTRPGSVLSAKHVVESACAAISEELHPSNARG